MTEYQSLPKSLKKIVFYDTFLEKISGQTIELFRRQYSDTEHRVGPERGLMSCIYQPRDGQIRGGRLSDL